jgi:hypothetical protein
VAGARCFNGKGVARALVGRHTLLLTPRCKGAGLIRILTTANPAACNCFSTPSARSNQASKVCGKISGSVTSAKSAR